MEKRFIQRHPLTSLLAGEYPILGLEGGGGSTRIVLRSLTPSYLRTWVVSFEQDRGARVGTPNWS